MRRRFLLAVSAVLVAAGAAFAEEEVRELSAKATEILSKYDAGEGVKECLPMTQIDSIKPLEDRMLLVEAGGKFYLNETPSRCSGAAHGNRRLEFSTSTAELCRGQIVKVVDNTSGAMVGSCALGEFHALVKKPAED